MRSIMGLTPPGSGRVMWKGRDIAQPGPHRICCWPPDSTPLAEQNLQLVMALADRVYILEKGEVRFTGTSADLKAGKRIVQQFLTV